MSYILHFVKCTTRVAPHPATTISKMQCHVRIAKPVSNLAQTQQMYCAGLGLSVVGHFENHEGFDGVMLGSAGMSYHFEFTHCNGHIIKPATTVEDLVVFYEANHEIWSNMCQNMIDAGFQQVTSFNPYWEINGRTFKDSDGYRIVLQNGNWENVTASDIP